MSDSRTVLTHDPLNVEAALGSLGARLTPLADFYIRSNFPAPRLDHDAWRLRIGGAVARPMSLSLDELKSRSPTTRRVTLECAGNGRTFLEPPAEGTPWTLGATGTATFTGTPLALLLDEAGVDADAVEVLFTGADRGRRDGWGEIAFQRSLPLEVGRRETQGPLVAWEMNGAPLLPPHGAPVRLVVPGWYAVASVKWLEEIRVLTRPFEGHFQTDRYLYKVPGKATEPVREMRVRALLTDPDPEDRDATGAVPVSGPVVRLAGIAWSGAAPVSGVRLSCDGGSTWVEAEVADDDGSGAAVPWRVELPLVSGDHEVVVRARDASGAEQPLEPVWNELGYGNNGVQRVRLRVE